MRFKNILVGLTAIMMAVSACGGGSTSSGSSGSGKVIRLLLDSPLTGSGADVGTQMCNGSKLAASDINSAGGISAGPMKGATIEIECDDNANYSSQVSATLANKFLSDPSIWAQFGFASSDNALAASQVVASAGLTIVGSAVSADYLTQKAHNIVNIFPLGSDVGAAWTDFCHSYFGANKVALVALDFGYIDTYLEGVQRELSKLGMTMTTKLRYSYGRQDYAPLLTAAKANNSGCIFLGGSPGENGPMVAQARHLGITNPLVDFSADGSTPTDLSAGGQSMKGYIWGEFLPIQPASGSLLAKVSAEYQGKYSAKMTYYAAYPYDSVVAIATAIAAGVGSREQLLSKLPGISAAGTTGPIKFDANKRILARSLFINEQTGTGVSDAEQVGQYALNADGTVAAGNLASCSSRPTCQLNLYH